MQLLPKGVLGLVVAGLLAAMMSSVSATFNSASTLITMDFASKLNPKLTSKQLVRVGQISTLILVILASAWVPYIERVSDSLWKYLQLVISYTAPPAVSTFVLGLFWKRANGTGSIASLLYGFVFAVFMLSIQIFGSGMENMPEWMNSLANVHFLMMAFLLFISCLIVHIVVSLSTKAPDKIKTTSLTWNRKLIAEETEELSHLPWYQNYRYLALILFTITALLVIYFW
jgi:SSS family solute:Na+ symporter